MAVEMNTLALYCQHCKQALVFLIALNFSGTSKLSVSFPRMDLILELI